MTRTYALRKLLEHGPLTRREIAATMGGKHPVAALDALLKSGAAHVCGHKSTPVGRVFLYGLA